MQIAIYIYICRIIFKFYYQNNERYNLTHERLNYIKLFFYSGSSVSENKDNDTEKKDKKDKKNKDKDKKEDKSEDKSEEENKENGVDEKEPGDGKESREGSLKKKDPKKNKVCRLIDIHITFDMQQKCWHVINQLNYVLRTILVKSKLKHIYHLYHVN